LETYSNALLQQQAATMTAIIQLEFIVVREMLVLLIWNNVPMQKRRSFWQARFLRLVVNDCGLRGFGGSGSGLHHVPPKTGYCRNLCGCGVIFVVRDSSNPHLANHRRKQPAALLLC